MAYLEKPKGYWYWFKQSLRMCFPMKKDFYGLGDAIMCIGAVILRQIFRLIVLVTFPISVPAFALVFKISEKNTMQRRAKTLSQDWDGMPPMYTKEQVEAVLRGETTQEELDAEQERNFYKH